MCLGSSDSESSSSETDDSDSESDGSSDTDADSDTEGEDFGAIEKKPVRAKQKGRAMYIYMYTVFMLLKRHVITISLFEPASQSNCSLTTLRGILKATD